jgi:hypothetical protein
VRSRKRWALRVALLVLLFGLVPSVAFADNCSGQRDCFASLAAVAAAAAAAGALAGAAAAGGDYDVGSPVRELGSVQRPPKQGFVFLRSMDGKIEARQSPSYDAPRVAIQPAGTRALYTDRVRRDGKDWYYVQTPGTTPGWVAADNTSSRRPTTLPSTAPIHLSDSQLGVAKTSDGMTAGARG